MFVMCDSFDLTALSEHLNTFDLPPAAMLLLVVMNLCPKDSNLPRPLNDLDATGYHFYSVSGSRSMFCIVESVSLSCRDC